MSAPDLAASIIPVTPFAQNCTILWEKGSRRGVVVDPGREVPRLREAVGALGVTVEAVLLPTAMSITLPARRIWRRRWRCR